MNWRKWLTQALCRHVETTAPIAVSGYGYTEYRVWFCCRCDKAFSKQTMEQQ